MQLLCRASKFFEPEAAADGRDTADRRNMVKNARDAFPRRLGGNEIALYDPIDCFKYAIHSRGCVGGKPYSCETYRWKGDTAEDRANIPLYFVSSPAKENTDIFCNICN